MRRFALLKTLAALSLLSLVRVRAQEQCAGLTDAAKDACDMQAAFGGSTVVPDVLPTFDPSGALYVQYGNIVIGGAQQLSPVQTASQPNVRFVASNSSYSTDGKQFLLAVVDPDSPSTSGDILHWMQQDASVGSDGAISSTTAAAAPYNGPNPPQGSGAHRYTFLLYEQPSNFALPPSASNLPSTIGGGRRGFDLAGFVQTGQLGNPVGGSFFKATYDGQALPSASAASGSTAPSSSSASAASASTAASSSASSRSQSSSTSASPATSGSSTASAPSSSSSTSPGSSIVATGFSIAVAAACLSVAFA